MNALSRSDERLKSREKNGEKIYRFLRCLLQGVTVSYEYVITLQNGLDREIDLTIRDPFPISRDAQIKITRELPRSEEVKMTEEGIIIWQLKLKSQSTKPCPSNSR